MTQSKIHTMMLKAHWFRFICCLFACCVFFAIRGDCLTKLISQDDSNTCDLEATQFKDGSKTSNLV